MYLLSTALFASTVITSAAYYWVLPDRDAPYQDFKKVDNASVAELEAVCDGLAECLGFNAGGFLKNNLTLLQPGATTMYIKSAVPQPPPVTFALWPWPSSLVNGSGVLTLDAANFTLVAGTPGSSDLVDALDRARSLIFARGSQYQRSTSTLTVTLASLTVTLDDGGAAVLPFLGVNESYVLDIPANGAPATLRAATIFGAYHGLQTFAQLVNFVANATSGGGSYVLRGAPLHIVDEPAFAWRGLMLDVARHYLPLTYIFTTIDAMATAKLNALHLHLADWQAGPFSIPEYPDLWDGAFTSDDVYTLSEMSSVVEYARARGIRVIPELDTPGHAASLCVGLPWLCPTPFCTDVLAPYDATLSVIAAILDSWAGVFPDAYTHLGGDEVGTDCWTSTPAVVQWMADRGFSPRDTYQYFVNRTTAMARSVGKIDVRWCDVFRAFNASGMSRDTVVQVRVSSYACNYVRECLQMNMRNTAVRDTLSDVATLTVTGMGVQ